MTRSPTWQDWLQSAKLCEGSMKFFEKPRIAAIKTLSKRIAQDGVLGHLRKAYHNLDLANKVLICMRVKERLGMKVRIISIGLLLSAIMQCTRLHYLRWLLSGRKVRLMLQLFVR